MSERHRVRTETGTPAKGTGFAITLRRDPRTRTCVTAMTTDKIGE